MQQKLNIIFLSSWYPCKNNLHNGNFVVRHAVAVSKFANVYVIYACADDTVSAVKTEVIENNGITEIRIYYPRIKNNLPFIGQAMKFLYLKKLYSNAFVKLKKQIGVVNLIHANVIYPVGVIARFLSVKFSIPFVVTEHWTGYMPENRKVLSYHLLMQARKVAKSASVVMPVSHDLKDSMRRLRIKANYKVVYNVVDTDLFSLKEPLHKPFRFIHVSTLVDEHKNVSGIIRAVKKLSETRLDFNMLILGDGDFQQYISYAASLEIPESALTIKGVQPIAKIADMMRQSDVFVLFSNYESFSCVISEALCAGLPVISSDAGAIKERLDDSNGIIINRGDEKALTEKMSSIIDNYKQYNSEKISEDAIKKYNYHEVGKQYFDIYHEVLNNKA